MYEKFYSFTDRPFTIVPNPGCLYMSSRHKLAFAHLQYGLLEGTGFVVLTGGIGTGKTTLLRFLLGKIAQVMDVAVIFNTNVSGAELLRLIIREFEAGEPGGDKAANLALLNDFLIERFRQGRQTIVIIDEAQNLSREALEEVRLLSNLQGSTRPLLQVVLCGQPELRRKLADPALTQLAQRITSTFHLEPLNQEDTGHYIRFRLAKAGGSPGLFDDEAIQAVHRISGGVPRVINILCNSALVHGYADELPVIGRAVVEEAAAVMASTADGSAGEPSAGMELTPDQEERLAAMERRLTVLEERFAAWGADCQLLNLEVAALKEQLASVRNPADAAPSAPDRPVDGPQVVVAPEPEKSGGFLRWLFRGR